MVEGELSFYHDLIPSIDTFVPMVSFSKVYKINPVEDYLHFIDVITLENISVCFCETDCVKFK